MDYNIEGVSCFEFVTYNFPLFIIGLFGFVNRVLPHNGKYFFVLQNKTQFTDLRQQRNHTGAELKAKISVNHVISFLKFQK